MDKPIIIIILHSVELSCIELRVDQLKHFWGQQSLGNFFGGAETIWESDDPLWSTRFCVLMCYPINEEQKHNISVP